MGSLPAQPPPGSNNAPAVEATNANAAALNWAEYTKDTNLLAQTNESWNANNLLVSSIRADAARLSKQDQLAKRNIYMLRQTDLHAEYMRHSYTAVARLIMLGTIVTMGLLIPVALWRAGRLSLRGLLVLDGLLLGLALVVLIAAMAWMAHMRRDVWGKRRWQLNQQLTTDARARSMHS